MQIVSSLAVESPELLVQDGDRHGGVGVERVRDHEAGIDDGDGALASLERHRPEEPTEKPGSGTVGHHMPGAWVRAHGEAEAGARTGRKHRVGATAQSERATVQFQSLRTRVGHAPILAYLIWPESVVRSFALATGLFPDGRELRDLVWSPSGVSLRPSGV